MLSIRRQTVRGQSAAVGQLRPDASHGAKSMECLSMHVVHSLKSNTGGGGGLKRAPHTR